MTSSKYKKNQLKFLCSKIGSTPEQIEHILDNVDAYYRERLETKPDKVTGNPKTYKDGTVKTRPIRPSKNTLKKIQSSIKTKILASIPLPWYVQGGVKKKSNITNAKFHQGKKYKFTTDLQAFFPSVKNNDVYKMFLQQGFSSYLSSVLTKLTTWKYELPQGTSTSSHIANLVFLNVDYKLYDLCKSNDITYTRYVDDLTFSSAENFKPILDVLLKIVTDNGYKISYRKTEYAGLQIITGIPVYNNYIDVPDKIKIKAKEEQELDLQNKPFTNYMNRVRSTNTKK